MNDKKMLDNIKNYGKEIITLDSYADAVRKTPAQFLGYRGNRGFINMVREIFQNAADELMKDSSPCDTIWIVYSEKNTEVMVKDNGRGVPFDDIIRVFATEHTSSNYAKKPGEFSSGRHGVGAKAVNACSEFFVVDSYRLGEGRRVTFKWGNPDTAKVEDIGNKDNLQGTMVTFSPIFSVMGQITTTWQDVRHLVISLIPLLKIGAKINFIGIDKAGNKHAETFINNEGLSLGLRAKTSAPIIPPISFAYTRPDGRMKTEITFTYDAKDELEDISSYGNFCPTKDGTHVQGFLEGLTKYFREYMNKFYLRSNSKLKITSGDIRIGLKAMVTVAHLEPEFTGQAKENISNDDIKPFVKDVTFNALENWSKTNPGDLQKICGVFKTNAEIRTRSEQERVKLDKSKVSAISGLPTKYIKPTGHKNLELFIVEGDSALGPAKNNRINEMQGLFPIRGKSINAMTSSKAKILANPEVASIIRIIDAGYGSKFDINKCKWDKVIICTDADPDGAHIRTLLLKFFLLYMAPLVSNGKLYATVPPLYGGVINKKQQYFTDKSEYNNYLQSLFSKSHDLRLADGKKINKEEIHNLLDMNTNYIRDLETVSNSFAVNPKLLEYCCVLINANTPFKAMKKLIESRYRFLDVKQENNTLSISGIIDGQYQTLFFNDILANACRYIMEYIKNSPSEYLIDNVPSSLYDLMAMFRDLAPKSIQRYKGLGEMNGPQLAESTLSPFGRRVLIRYTTDDIKYEIERMREIESDNIQLIKDIDISNYTF